MAVLWDTGIVCGCAVDDGACYIGEENKEIKSENHLHLRMYCVMLSKNEGDKRR